MKKAFRVIKEYLVITAGMLIASAGISLFLEPHNIVAGGVSGIAIIISNFTDFPMGIITLALNIPIFILGVVFLGNSFGVKSLYGAVTFSLFIDLTANIPFHTESINIASIFGGLLLGVGLGTVFLSGATSGGTDIIAAICNKLIRAIDVGKWIFIVDIAVILAGAYFIGNTDSVLSGIFALFINSFLIDYVITGANHAKMVYVISEDSETIARKIMAELNRGVTGIFAKGMYTNGERTMLMCLVKRFELPKLEKIVEETDENAFMILTQARQVRGEGFINYPINNKK